MIVGALPLSGDVRWVYFGWRQLKSGWPNLERRAQPITRRRMRPTQLQVCCLGSPTLSRAARERAREIRLE